MSTRTRIGSSDLEVSGLALGGNVFGWTADQETAFGVLDAFVAGGGDLIDTADVYPAWAQGRSGGESETIIGEWLAARGNRDRVVIATKVASHPEFKGLGPHNVRDAVDASLERLGIDRIDLYYAHYDDPATPLEKAVAVFSELVDAGKVRAIGLSNFTPERVAAWCDVARAGGYHAPVALQPHYNLVERGFERNGLRDVAERESLGVFPYYSLAEGFLAGKYRDAEAAVAAGASERAEDAVRYLNTRGRQVLAALDEIAAARGVEVATVSLAWLRQQPTVVAPIASARDTEQLAGLLASLELELSADELNALAEASA